MPKVWTKDTIQSASPEDLLELRSFLFKECIRIEEEKSSLNNRITEFDSTRMAVEQKMGKLHKSLQDERQKLSGDQALFNKQLSILHNGFNELNNDKKKLETDRAAFAIEKTRLRRSSSDMVRLLFVGIENLNDLKKRYRDLMKIYHPDNMCGDSKMTEMISEEYCRQLQQYA